MADPELGFEEFMAARWPPLFRTAYLLTGDRHEAEDLLQTALARPACAGTRSATRVRPTRTSVGPWSTSPSARWKRRGREVVTDEVPGRGADDHLAVRADHLALWAEVRRLPARMRATRRAPLLRGPLRRRDRPELGCSEGAVKSQTHHALRRLRDALPALDLTEELS